MNRACNLRVSRSYIDRLSSQSCEVCRAMLVKGSPGKLEDMSSPSQCVRNTAVLRSIMLQFPFDTEGLENCDNVSGALKDLGLKKQGDRLIGEEHDYLASADRRCRSADVSASYCCHTCTCGCSARLCSASLLTRIGTKCL